MELFILFLYFFGGLSMWIADWSVLPDTFMEDLLLHLFIHFFYFIISPRMQTSAFSLLCTVWHCALLGIDWRRFFTGRLLHFLLYCIMYYYMLLTDAAWSQITGHSALRTMWLIAPVLAYVPVDIDTEVCATPTALCTRGCAALQWLIDTWESSYL